MGRPFDAESVAHIIERGNQQQRQYAALIKALQSKHSPLERIDF
ncbi:hypothetical protein [Marinomonas rhizomae]|nr:hypothetical protein [Marinomonas rhizomae]